MAVNVQDFKYANKAQCLKTEMWPWHNRHRKKYRYYSFKSKAQTKILFLKMRDVRMCNLKKKKPPVAQRHQMVSDSLALLLFIGLDLPLGVRAPIGDKVL